MKKLIIILGLLLSSPFLFGQNVFKTDVTSISHYTGNDLSVDPESIWDEGYTFFASEQEVMLLDGNNAVMKFYVIDNATIDVDGLIFNNTSTRISKNGSMIPADITYIDMPLHSNNLQIIIQISDGNSFILETTDLLVDD